MHASALACPCVHTTGTRRADELVDRGHGTGTCWPHAGAASATETDRRRRPRSTQAPRPEIPAQPCDAQHVTATGRPAGAPYDTTTSKQARGFIFFLVACMHCRWYPTQSSSGYRSRSVHCMHAAIQLARHFRLLAVFVRALCAVYMMIPVTSLSSIDGPN